MALRRPGLLVAGVGAALLPATGSWVGCSDPVPRSPAVVATDSAGVRLVANRGDPPRFMTLASEPLLAIGALDGASAVQFSNLLTAAWLADGIVVVDGGSQEIRAFGLDGRHRWTAGGRGEAPGEFAEITWVGVDAEDGITVWDTGRARATSLAPADGEVVSSLDLPVITFLSRIVGRYRDGSFLARHSRILPPETPGEWLPNHSALSRERPSGSDTLLSFEGRPLADLGGVISMVPLTIEPGGFVRSDTAWLLIPPAPGYQVRDGAGRLVARVDGPVAARPVTDSLIDAYEAGELARWSAPASRAQVARWLDESAYPDSVGPYDRILPGAEGGTWLRRFQPVGSGPSLWDAFDHAGRLVFSVAVPGGLRITDVAGPRALVIARDELDVEFVRVYELEETLATRPTAGGSDEP